jgi:hypothetical protein
MHTPGSTSAVGYGWKLGLFVPGDNVERMFIMWGNQFNMASRLTAKLYDRLGTSHTADADNGGSATTRQVRWEVTYRSPVSTWMEIRALAIQSYTTTANFKLNGMAIVEV